MHPCPSLSSDQAMTPPTFGYVSVDWAESGTFHGTSLQVCNFENREKKRTKRNPTIKVHRLLYNLKQYGVVQTRLNYYT